MTNTFRSHYFSIALLAVILTGAIMTVLSPSDVFAATCDKNETVVIECGDDVNGIWGILLIAINLLAGGVGILAVGGLVYGSIMWATAGDDANKLNNARSIVSNVIVGILCFAFTFSGLQFLLPGGVFNRTFEFASKTNSQIAKRDAAAIQERLKKAEAAKAKAKAAKAGSASGDASISTTTIKSVKNFRDAAALTGALKPGALYRSAKLSGMSGADAKTMASILGSGATIIDLRTGSQRSSKPDKAVAGSKKVNVPIEGILDTAPMVNDPTRRSQLAKALKAAASADGTVLIHCVAGKDRTGWAVAMIMYVNGATDAQVMREYLKSADAFPGEVKREWLNNGVQTARRKHGTIINYLRSIGLSNSDLAKLKSKFGA